MLLCSDGLWSMLPDHVLAQHLQNSTIVRAVPELIRTAAGIGGKKSDNVTALAMMWEGGSTVRDSTTITTNILPVGSVTTTIQAPRHADLESVDSFNDNEIEKAIEEIRGAIEKSSRLTSKN
jgi:protein phosphatase